MVNSIDASGQASTDATMVIVHNLVKQEKWQKNKRLMQ